jgi:hypothetical protein
VQTYTQIPKESYLTVGKYRVVYKANIFANQLEWLLENLSGLIERTFEVVRGKPIKITQIYQSESNNETYINVEFELLNNPVPAILIVGGIIGLLGMVGVLLVFEKIERISESPLGAGLGFSLSIGSVVLLLTGGFFLYSQFKN